MEQERQQPVWKKTTRKKRRKHSKISLTESNDFSTRIAVLHDKIAGITGKRIIVNYTNTTVRHRTNRIRQNSYKKNKVHNKNESPQLCFKQKRLIMIIKNTRITTLHKSISKRVHQENKTEQ